MPASCSSPVPRGSRSVLWAPARPTCAFLDGLDREQVLRVTAPALQHLDRSLDRDLVVETERAAQVDSPTAEPGPRASCQQIDGGELLARQAQGASHHRNAVAANLVEQFGHQAEAQFGR